MNVADDYCVAESSFDVASVFSPSAILMIPDDATKSEALSYLVKSLARAKRLPWDGVDSVIAALENRERYSTTGLGNGLALPHLRCRDISAFVGAVGVAPSGVDFDSLDGLPARLILLLLSPFEQRARHAEIMGRLAMLASDKTLRYILQLPPSSEALLRFLAV